MALDYVFLWIDFLQNTDHEYNQGALDFCTDNSLVDVWRHSNPKEGQFLMDWTKWKLQIRDRLLVNNSRNLYICFRSYNICRGLKMVKEIVHKSQGQGGFTTNFYQFFGTYIRELLFEALKECLDSNKLLKTMKRGIRKFITRPNKDKTTDNSRPIALLNVDYKIFSYVLTSRLKSGMNKIISNTQFGFLQYWLIRQYLTHIRFIGLGTLMNTPLYHSHCNILYSGLT